MKRVYEWMALCILLGCSTPDSATTQLLVSVSAEAATAARLARLELALYAADAHDGAAPQRVQHFALADSDAEGRRVAFPFSFGITKSDAGQIVIVLRGSAADDSAIIEHKLSARFEKGITRRLDVVLADACLEHVCTSLERTCSPSAPPGSCVSVASGQPIDAGAPHTDAAVSDAAASGERQKEVAPGAAGSSARAEVKKPSAVTYAGAHTRDAALDVDAQTPPVRDGTMERGGICGEPNACESAYPCVEGSAGGYACQGQMADWLVADVLPGAKASPSYDYTSETDVVVDRVTGLVWQRNLPTTYPGCSGNAAMPGDGCTWLESKAYCAQLTLADERDWRLPSKIELESLIGDTAHLPAIDFNAFPGVSGGQTFWTGAPMVGANGTAWTVRSGFAVSLPQAQTQQYVVRCVRGAARTTGTPADRYKLSAASDAVSDTHTQLTWQRDYGDVDTIDAARAYCAELGQSWRLPALKELLSLVDPTRFEPAIHPLFPAVPLGGWFWTDTARVPIPMQQSEAMVVEFSAGMAGDANTARLSQVATRGTFHARCVR